MEEKKKKTTTKKTTTKKTTAKKEAAVKEKPVKEVKAVKKDTTKKTPKKTTPKKTPKKVEPKVVEEKVEKKEELLEKTYIFTKDEQNNLDEVVSKLNKDKIVVEQEVVDRKESNRNIILVLLIAIVAIVLFCTVYILNHGLDEDESDLEASETTVIDGNSYKKMELEDNTGDEDANTFADIEYSNITNTNINDFELKVAKAENMLVIISSQTCYFCVTFEPIINEVLVTKNDKILRLNISKMNKEETKRLRSYYKFTEAPTILVIKKGEVVADQVGAMSKEEFDAWYDKNVAA